VEESSTWTPGTRIDYTHASYLWGWPTAVVSAAIIAWREMTSQVP
jgi:hypothetical protein